MRNSKPLSPIVVVLFNLIIIGGLFCLMKDWKLTPCKLPEVIRLSWSIFLLLFFHLAWRYLHQSMQKFVDNIPFGPIKIPGQAVIVLCKQLHLRMLPDIILWVLVGFSGLALVIISSNRFPLFQIQEATPIIQGFSVQYLPNDPTTMYLPNDVIEIRRDQQLRVEAVILGGYPGSCEWYSVKGTLLPGEKCSILYSPSIGEGGDNLTVTVWSPCKTQQTSTSIFIINP